MSACFFAQVKVLMRIRGFYRNEFKVHGMGVCKSRNSVWNDEIILGSWKFEFYGIRSLCDGVFIIFM